MKYTLLDLKRYIKKYSFDITNSQAINIYNNTQIFQYNKKSLVVIPKSEESFLFWSLNTDDDWYIGDFLINQLRGIKTYICLIGNCKYYFTYNDIPFDEFGNFLKNIEEPILRQLALITNNIQSIKQIDYKNRYEVFYFLKNDGKNIKLIPDEILTFNLIKTAIEQDGLAIQYIINKPLFNQLSKDKKELLVYIAITQNGCAIQYIPKEYIHNGSYLIAVNNNPNAIFYIEEELRTEALWKLYALLSPSLIDLLPKEYINELLYKDMCIYDGLSIQYIPIKSRTKEICELAITKNPYAIIYLKESIYYEYLCQFALNIDSNCFSFINPMVSNYYDLCKQVLLKSGEFIKDIQKDKIDYNLCKIAIKTSNFIILYMMKNNDLKHFINEELLNLIVDKDIKKIIIDMNYSSK